MTIHQIASDAIGLFLESLDHIDVKHGIDADDVQRATAMALNEIAEGAAQEEAMLALYPAMLAALVACEDRLTAEGTAKKETWAAIDGARAVMNKAKDVQSMFPT